MSKRASRRLVVAVTALVAVGLVAGALVRRVAPAQIDWIRGGVWLAHSETGSLRHVSSHSAKVDATIMIAGARGHDLRVIDDGARTVYVHDRTSGELLSIDTGRLAIAGATQVGTSEIHLTPAGRSLYVADPVAATVTSFDPDSLEPTGTPLAIESNGPPIVDGDRLVVVVAATGEIVRVDGGRIIDRTPVAAAEQDIVLTSTDAGAMVVNRSSGAVTSLDNGAVAEIRGEPGDLMVPLDSPTDSLFVVESGAGVIHRIDHGEDEAAAYGLGVTGHDLGRPLVEDDRIHVPDHSDGSIIVVEPGGVVLDRVGAPVDAASDVRLVGGHIIVDDPHSADATVVDPEANVEAASGNDGPVVAASPEAPPTFASPFPDSVVPACEGTTSVELTGVLSTSADATLETLSLAAWAPETAPITVTVHRGDGVVLAETVDLPTTPGRVDIVAPAPIGADADESLTVTVGVAARHVHFPVGDGAVAPISATGACDGAPVDLGGLAFDIVAGGSVAGGTT